MERTKLLFGYDQRLDSNHSAQNNRAGVGGVGGSGSKSKQNHQQNQLSQQQHQNNHQQQPGGQNGVSQSTNSQNNSSTDAVIKQLLELLKSSPNLTLNRSELLKNLGPGNNSKSSDLNSILAAILTSAGVGQLDDSGSTVSLNNLVPNESTVSLTSMSSSNAGQTGQLAKSQVSHDSNVETPTSHPTQGWTIFIVLFLALHI